MAKGCDFLIIGGGSAGSVLAGRLSENPSAQVLLLEAGAVIAIPFYHLPAGFAKVTKGIGSWSWDTVPQRHMQNKVFRYTQAKVIGGGSPRLLQLSGIGPADHLREHGIPVVLDQPQIGANLQDHLDLYCIAELSGPYSYDRYARPHWAALAGLQYIFGRRGPVASSLFETGGFWYADPAARSPDLQLHLGLGTGIEHGVVSMPQGGITLNSCYLRPRSRGSVRLQGSDPARAPLIDPHYLADPTDREMSIRGLKLTQEILAQGPLKKFILAERLPGPGVKSDQDYFDFICTHAKTSHHCAGTCRMGVDSEAVVDTSLRMNGIAGLRVVDNSIMPTVISSNTNAAAIMIGEKAADLIKAEHGMVRA